MPWTDDQVALLRQYWGTGKSASDIAAMLGGMSRNAVIGKAHRLGLSVPQEVPRAPRHAPPPRVVGASILGLTERMCKWPIGDPKQPDFHFCGATTAGVLPYCAHHVAIAYQPAKKRDDDERRVIGF